MSEKTVATTVIVTSVNHISEDEVEQLLDSHGVDSLDMVANDMQSQVETIVARRLFGDADSIPILDVSTEVYDEWDGRAQAEEQLNSQK